MADDEVLARRRIIELLEGRTIPRLRSEFVAMCAQTGLSPSQVGTLPYAVGVVLGAVLAVAAGHPAAGHRQPDLPGR